MNLLKSLAVSGLVAASAFAMAHVEQVHAKKAGPIKMEQKPWGIAGETRKAVRTIEVKMTDDMRFTPDLIQVRQGETIRLVHLNNGQVMHEFVLGTKKELDEHAALMKKFPNMEHDEPYMAHVAPGKTGEIVWTFNRVGEFDFACLLPGHYEAGMVGKIEVIAK
ncbi:MAG: plastocyanin [Comamonadaceae bacterium]|nr:plastocyanin [Comamonadaceae bacterium]